MYHSDAQFTMSFALLRESNAATDQTGGGTQVVMGVMTQCSQKKNLFMVAETKIAAVSE